MNKNRYVHTYMCIHVAHTLRLLCTNYSLVLHLHPCSSTFVLCWSHISPPCSCYDGGTSHGFVLQALFAPGRLAHLADIDTGCFMMACELHTPHIIAEGRRVINSFAQEKSSMVFSFIYLKAAASAADLLNLKT